MTFTLLALHSHCRHCRIRAVVFLLAMSLSSPLAFAARFGVLHHFTPSEGSDPGPIGAPPVFGQTLRGTLRSGGTGPGGTPGRGVLYEIGTDGSGFRALHTFVGADGARPLSLPTLITGGLVGLTYAGGRSDGGTYYRMNYDGSGFTTLYHFPTPGQPGSHPNGLGSFSAGGALGGNDGNPVALGTAEGSGVAGDFGAFFKISLDGTGFTLLRTFNGAREGAAPNPGLPAFNQPIRWGTTQTGGLPDTPGTGPGIIYRTDLDTFTITPLFVFGGQSGEMPLGLEADSSQRVYGVTREGGQHGKGVLFRMGRDGTGFTVLHHFAGGEDGANPQARILILNDLIIGSTSPLTRRDASTLFRINLDGSNYQVFHRFNSAIEGTAPNALFYNNRRITGAASRGGSADCGTLFSYDIYSLPFDQTVATDKDKPVTITLTGDFPEGLDRLFSVEERPSHGTVAVTDNPLTAFGTNFTYRPAAGYIGTDTFTVRSYTGIDTSGTATITVFVGTDAPQFTSVPSRVSVVAGESASLAATVTSATPVTFQWYFNNTAIVGATNSSLSFPVIDSARAGTYKIVAGNASGKTIINSFPVVVQPVPVKGAYLQKLGSGSSTASLSLIVGIDRMGDLLLDLGGGNVLSGTVSFDQDGRFVTSSLAWLRGAGAAPAVTGRIAQGVLTANVTGLPGVFTATATGAAGLATGRYIAASSGLNQADLYLAVADSQVHAVVLRESSTESGLGTISATGAIAISLGSGTTLTGALDASGQLALTNPSAPAGSSDFTGFSSTLPVVKRLSNISTRAQTGTGDAALITGFVLQGNEPKSLLIRAAGPALTTFGVPGALARPQIQLYRGDTVIAINAGWATGASADTAVIAQAATRLGAFPFATSSADAALFRSLQPGAYTAVVSGIGGATGITLVEVYDTSADSSRLINLSTRGFVGRDDQSLIVGIVIEGNLPKRLLIRAVGPTLAGFGASGTISDPKLELRSGPAVVATNNDWSDDVRINAAGAAVGAFALAAGSKDSALLIALAPGTYSAVVSGVANVTGVALVEVYEVP